MEVMMEEVKMEISNQEVSGCLVGLGKRLKYFDLFLFAKGGAREGLQQCIEEGRRVCVLVACGLWVATPPTQPKE